MALKGIKVIELAGLAPVPFCGMILSDFGASVIRVDRSNGGPQADSLGRGKRSIAVNLKDPRGQELVEKLSATADVLIEPFRPGVMEKLNLGPEKLMKQNPRLIYARLSGYGQNGAFAKQAGHDINYMAMSGVLSMLGRKHENPSSSINLLADFAGGGLTCALGIVMSLFERVSSGKGQMVDTSMTEGASYVSSFLFKTKHLPIWGKPRGENWLDTGAHFYDTYKTKDGKFMAVGSLEPQFYSRLLKGLELSNDSELVNQFSDHPENKAKIANTFLKKSQQEWVTIFNSLDACVTPVLEIEEASEHIHNQDRNSFVKNPFTNNWEPQPAPVLSRTPGNVKIERPDPEVGEHTLEILQELQLSNQSIKELTDSGVVEISDLKSKL